MAEQPHRSETTQYVQSRKVVMAQVAGGTVLLPASENQASLECLYHLNAVGAAVWAELDKPVTLDSVIENVCVQFITDDTEGHDIPERIRSFINELHEAGFVETTK